MKKKFIIIFFLIIFFILFATVKGRPGNPTPEYALKNLTSAGQPFELSPERNRYAQVLAWVDFKSGSLPQNIAEFVLPDLGYANGHFVSVYPPGLQLMLVPLYVLGKLISFGQLATGLLEIFAALICLYLIVEIGKKFKTNIFASYLAGILFLFATPAWSYTTTIYQHLITTAILLGMLLITISEQKFLRTILFWFLALLAVTIDFPNIIFVLPILIYFVFGESTVDPLHKIIKLRLKVSLILTALLLLPILAFWGYYNNQVYGSATFISATATAVRELNTDGSPKLNQQSLPSPTSFSVSKFLQVKKLENGLVVLLTSRDRGMILYTPIILLSFLGIASCLKKRKGFSITIFWVLSCILLLYAMWGDPWGGWAFGPRYLIPAFGLLSIFFAQAISLNVHKLWFKLTLLALGLYSIFVNALGAVTSNQIPPYHEASGLGMKYNFLLNWDFLRAGVSGSFVYNTILQRNIPLIYFFVSLFLLVVIISVLLFILVIQTTPIKKSHEK